ncbi:MAG: molybdopterin synthase sulfur carrier subunit [Thermoprotei archaeon]|nr:MAG: molybdopterin synthase sulfur carrier subunit [Thermoprotei archaeon]
MKVRVTLTAAFRERARTKQLLEELPEGSKLKDLIARLALRYGGVFNEVVDQSGSLNPDLLLLVNGLSVSDLDYELKDGDEVMLGLSIVGGKLRAVQNDDLRFKKL